MKISRIANAIFAIVLSAPVLLAQAQQTPMPAANAATSANTGAASSAMMQKSIEAYLRHVYAFGPDVALTVDPPKESPVTGLLETNIHLKVGGNEQSAIFYVSANGKYLFRGELSDLTKDPLAEARSQIQLKDAPAMGDPNAPITLVEYSDFECPVCKNLHNVLRTMLPRYPNVRIVFKDFPIEQIHPWARTAALAGRCAYNQDPKAFWKIYDLIYDGQDVISAGNAWNKMTDFAAQAGLNADTFKTCMASPEAAAAVDVSRANGQALEVNSTPTMFINGRRLVGADEHAIEQYIKYELDQQKSKPVAEKKP